MIEEVKARLAECPEAIIRILESYGFARITHRKHEIRCAFEEGMNPTAIVIKLKNNPACLLKDYEKNVCYDLINYLIKIKKHTFKEVISRIKAELGIDNIYNYRRSKAPFGGIYNRIGTDGQPEVKIYPESTLDKYLKIPNERFLNDHISLEVQKEFQIGYDAETQRITIPIRSAFSDLIGVKGRANFELGEYEPKYLYLSDSCPASTTLYGYCQNYTNLYEGTVLIGEAEKFVLQCATYGYRNAVALASNSLSTAQAKLLLDLKPKKIIFMLDNNLDLANTKKNIDVLRASCQSQEIEIGIWDWRQNITCDYKASPTDAGKAIFEEILQTEIVDADELFKEK